MCVSSAAELQQHTESILPRAKTRNAVVSFNRHCMILRLSVGVDHEVAGEPRGKKLWANGPVARIRCGQAVGSGRTMKTAVAITRWAFECCGGVSSPLHLLGPYAGRHASGTTEGRWRHHCAPSCSWLITHLSLQLWLRCNNYRPV